MHNFTISSHSGIFPYKSTTITALVFLVIHFVIVSALKHKVFGSMSANTGFAPTYKIGEADATQVKSGTITSSPFLISRAIRAKCNAAVQCEVFKTNFFPIYFEKYLENFSLYLFIFGPQPFLIASFAYKISVFVIDG